MTLFFSSVERHLRIHDASFGHAAEHHSYTGLTAVMRRRESGAAPKGRVPSLATYWLTCRSRRTVYDKRSLHTCCRGRAGGLGEVRVKEGSLCCLA